MIRLMGRHHQICEVRRQASCAVYVELSILRIECQPTVALANFYQLTGQLFVIRYIFHLYHNRPFTIP